MDKCNAFYCLFILFSGITARETISPGLLVHVWSVKPRKENLVCVCVVRVSACACICMCRFFAEDGFSRLVFVCVSVCVCVTRVKFMLDMLLVDFELYSSTYTSVQNTLQVQSVARTNFKFYSYTQTSQVAIDVSAHSGQTNAVLQTFCHICVLAVRESEVQNGVSVCNCKA